MLLMPTYLLSPVPVPADAIPSLEIYSSECIHCIQTSHSLGPFQDVAIPERDSPLNYC